MCYNFKSSSGNTWYFNCHKKECCSTVIIQGSMDPRLPTSNRDAVKYLFPRKEEIELDRLVKFNRFTLKHSPGKFNSKG
jgi:hypothetical protein